MMVDLQLMTEEACDFRAAEKFGHIAVAETLIKVKRLLMAHPSSLQHGSEWVITFPAADVPKIH
jgi:hypothetical protein